MTSKKWAAGLSADDLESYRKGNCTDDKWSRAAKREAKNRGRCGAISRDGDVCYRVAGHKKTWHEVELWPGGYNKYGKTLRTIRRENGLTQEKLANACGLNKTYISHIEAERKVPTLLALESICASLKVKLSEFIARAEKVK